MTTALTPQLQQAAMQEFTGDKGGLTKFLSALEGAVADVANQHASPTRIARLFIAEAGKNPLLLETMTTSEGRRSVAQFFMLAAQLGLEPGSAQGLMYATPRRENIAKRGESRRYAWTILPVVGYRGLAELARRSGELARLNAGVFSAWDLENGSVEASMEPPVLVHRWAPGAPAVNAKNLAGAYAVAELKDGSRVQVILTREEIDATRKRSPTGDKSFSPWSSDYPAMARKTALRRLLNGGLVPLSLESREALAVADSADPSAAPVAGLPVDRVALRPEGGAPALPDFGSEPDAPTLDRAPVLAAIAKAEEANPEALDRAYGDLELDGKVGDLSDDDLARLAGHLGVAT